jgi:hypothetical protein
VLGAAIARGVKDRNNPNAGITDTVDDDVRIAGHCQESSAFGAWPAGKR